MKMFYKLITVAILVVFSSCSSNQSLQEYYLESSEKPNFLLVDLPVSLLNLASEELTNDEKAAVDSFKKLSILAFNKDVANNLEYSTEKTKVNAILKNPRYSELMKMNTGFGKATIKYLGDDDDIEEVVIYGDSDDKGFVLVRVLGDDMKPENLVKLIRVFEKSDYDGKGLKEIGSFFKG